MTDWSFLTVALTHEADVVVARQQARLIAELLGFDRQDQTRFATAVSEIARNAFEHGGGGKACFAVKNISRGVPQALEARIHDQGPGIPDLDAVLEGRSTSRRGIGVGMIGAKRLVDTIAVQSAAGKGTTVRLSKNFDRRQPPVTLQSLKTVTAQLLPERSNVNPLAALSEQNRELVVSLDELRDRRDELARLNRELEDTNRGVVALYAELDENAEQLRQASELKSRFLSNISHEFRTPLSSILALSNLLLSRVDGELSAEQERQVGYIKRSAESLSELVNDLLDIAKVEAGKVELRPSQFTVDELFSALRGALKPLQKEGAVELVFDQPGPELPDLVTDEGKLAQILRNFISNALKFTPSGEVRVSARVDPVGEPRVLLSVTDSGIGIAPENHALIFEEFAQIDNPLQRAVKGTGLGLSLSRRLAQLLHGEITLDSTPGLGSTFTLAIPPTIDHDSGIPAGTPVESGVHQPTRTADATEKAPLVLIVDDEEAFRYALRQMIRSTGRPYEIEEAHDGAEGLARARALHPDAIVLDLQMPRLDGYAVLEQLAADPTTRDIPVLVSSSASLDDAVRRRLQAARDFIPKGNLTRDAIRAALERVLGLER